MRILLFSFLVSSLLPISAHAATYEIDPAHSSVNFVAPHLAVSKVRGRFDKFSGTFNFDEKSMKLDGVNVVVKTASINTNEPDRDKHLRSADFFDAAKFPDMTFKSTKVDYAMDKPKQVQGNLTIRGITKPVTLDVTYTGAMDDAFGNRVVTFEASSKINRKDFNVSWNKSLDKGGVVVGDEIEIQIFGEAKMPAPKKK